MAGAPVSTPDPAELAARLAAIVDVGRRTRKPTPRWLWLCAGVVGVACAIGFVLLVVGEPAASSSVPRVVNRSQTGSGLGTGLMIGAAVGIVIGFVIARHRDAHSSRNNP